MAMEDKDLPPGFSFNPSNEVLIDCYLKPMVEGESPPSHKIVESVVENFDSFRPSELDGAKDILDNKVTSKYFYVKRYRTSKNRMKVSRRAKDGTWRARGQYKKITTSSRVNAKIGVYEYVPKPKSQMCSGGGSDSGSKWIMEEFVLDRGENMFEDYAIRKVRLPLGGKRKHAKNEADDGPKEKGSHGGGPQTKPPLPIGNCTRENSETGTEEDGKEEPKVESFLPVLSHVTETPWYEDYYSLHDDC